VTVKDLRDSKSILVAIGGMRSSVKRHKYTVLTAINQKINSSKCGWRVRTLQNHR
jgi:hypothetical protein